MASDIEYEFGLFERSEGEDWKIVGRPYASQDGVEAAMEYFRERYPDSKFEARKRAVGGWERV